MARNKSANDYYLQADRLDEAYLEAKRSGNAARMALYRKAADAAWNRSNDIRDLPANVKTYKQAWEDWNNSHGSAAKTKFKKQMGGIMDKKYSTSKAAVYARTRRAQGLSAG